LPGGQAANLLHHFVVCPLVDDLSVKQENGLDVPPHGHWRAEFHTHTHVNSASRHVGDVVDGHSWLHHCKVVDKSVVDSFVVDFNDDQVIMNLSARLMVKLLDINVFVIVCVGRMDASEQANESQMERQSSTTCTIFLSWRWGSGGGAREKGPLLLASWFVLIFVGLVLVAWVVVLAAAILVAAPVLSFPLLRPV